MAKQLCANCAKTVDEGWDNPVQERAQFVHSLCLACQELRKSEDKPGVLCLYALFLFTQFYTAIRAFLPLDEPDFSPLSTGPTITTTIYI